MSWKAVFENPVTSSYGKRGDTAERRRALLRGSLEDLKRLEEAKRQGWDVEKDLAQARRHVAAFRERKDNPYPWTPSLSENTTAKLRLSRIRINQGGYDDRGRYWGVGAPLYFAEDDDGNHRALRAVSRAAAKAQFPNAKWYRD